MLGIEPRCPTEPGDLEVVIDSNEEGANPADTKKAVVEAKRTDIDDDDAQFWRTLRALPMPQLSTGNIVNLPG